MRNVFLVTGCFLLFISNVLGQEDSTDSSAKKGNDLIHAFLPQKLYQTLETTQDISFNKVQYFLIEGTEYEYSNKTTFFRNLNEEEKERFVQLLMEDTSYLWKDYSEESAFYACDQFIFKNESSQFQVLINWDKSLASFISLDGQQVVPIQKEVKDFIEDLN